MSRYTTTYPSYPCHLSSDSDALRTAIGLSHRHLHTVIVEGTIAGVYLALALRTLIDLNPFQAMDNAEFAFSWIALIFNTGSWQGDAQCCHMAGEVVRALGKHLFLDSPAPPVILPSWISPVLGFLSSCEKWGVQVGHSIQHPLHSAFYQSVQYLRTLLQKSSPYSHRHCYPPILYSRAFWP